MPCRSNYGATDVKGGRVGIWAPAYFDLKKWMGCLCFDMTENC